MLRIIATTAAIILLAGGSVFAAEHEIRMLNKGSDGRTMVFEPDFVVAAPGDTIRFVVSDKGHNAETLPGAWPEGVAPVKGKINEEIVVKIEQEGVYAFKCMPHVAMGMVALVTVGKAVNLEQAKAVKAPGKMKTSLNALLQKAATQ
jgi:pseudoazurin